MLEKKGDEKRGARRHRYVPSHICFHFQHRSRSLTPLLYSFLTPLDSPISGAKKQRPMEVHSSSLLLSDVLLNEVLVRLFKALDTSSLLSVCTHNLIFSFLILSSFLLSVFQFVWYFRSCVRSVYGMRKLSNVNSELRTLGYSPQRICSIMYLLFFPI